MKRTIIYALYTTLGMIVYFLAMKILGFETNYYLRAFNFIIIAGGVYFLLRDTIVRSGESVGYIQGLGKGLIMTMVAVSVFLLFLIGYIEFFDPGFMEVLDASNLWGNDLSILEISFGVLVQAGATGFIISFIWMQYFKRYVPEKDAT